MKFKQLLSFFLFSSLSWQLSAQEQQQGIDYGSFVMYKNQKYIQQFTIDKFDEIKDIIESKRQDHTEVRWDITEYTYVIIKPRDVQTTSGTTNPREEEE